VLSRPGLSSLFVYLLEGRDLAKHFGCKFIETSAKQRINVDEAFSNLVREIRKYNKVNLSATLACRINSDVTTQEQQTGRPVMANSGTSGPGVYGGAKDSGDGDHGGCCSGCVVV
jgi:GTPase KRas